IFSFELGRFFWKWPKQIPYPVTVSFGPPMPSTASANEVRQVIQELGSAACEHRKSADDRLDLRLVQSARRNWKRLAMADSTGQQLTYGHTLAGAVLLSRRMRNLSGNMIGVLLPPGVGGALVNLGITLAGRVPVNLNFTAGRESMVSAMQQCGIETIVTSRVFLEKAKLEAAPGMIFVEDLLTNVAQWDRLRAWLAARLLPARLLCASGLSPDSLATVIFSSGSTGVPKGVMLSHANVLANIAAISQVYWIGSQDRIAGGLPFFHSFGFTVTIWF